MTPRKRQVSSTHDSASWISEIWRAERHSNVDDSPPITWQRVQNALQTGSYFLLLICGNPGSFELKEDDKLEG